MAKGKRENFGYPECKQEGGSPRQFGEAVIREELVAKQHKSCLETCADRHAGAVLLKDTRDSLTFCI